MSAAWHCSWTRPALAKTGQTRARCVKRRVGPRSLYGRGSNFECRHGPRTTVTTAAAAQPASREIGPSPRGAQVATKRVIPSSPLTGEPKNSPTDPGRRQGRLPVVAGAGHAKSTTKTRRALSARAKRTPAPEEGGVGWREGRKNDPHPPSTLPSSQDPREQISSMQHQSVHSTSWLIGSVWEKSAPADSSAPGLSQGGASPRHAAAMRRLAPRIDICRRLRVRASVQSLSPLAAPPTYLLMLS